MEDGREDDEVGQCESPEVEAWDNAPQDPDEPPAEEAGYGYGV